MFKTLKIEESINNVPIIFYDLIQPFPEFLKKKINYVPNVQFSTDFVAYSLKITNYTYNLWMTLK